MSSEGGQEEEFIRHELYRQVKDKWNEDKYKMKRSRPIFQMLWMIIYYDKQSKYMI